MATPEIPVIIGSGALARGRRSSRKVRKVFEFFPDLYLLIYCFRFCLGCLVISLICNCSSSHRERCKTLDSPATPVFCIIMVLPIPLKNDTFSPTAFLNLKSTIVPSHLPCLAIVLPKKLVSPKIVSCSASVSSQPSVPKDADGSSSSSEPQHQLDSNVDAFLDSLKWDEKGLMVAIAQNIDTGAIMMQGFINKEALAKTISSQKATFYSRSRSSLWTKGETSTNFIHVFDIFFDCDFDSVIYIGKPDGPSCHTGSETCYFLSMSDVLRRDSQPIEPRLALTTLYSLENTILQRRDEAMTSAKPSWTKRLLNDAELLCSKVREEAEELVQTVVEKEDSSRTASEMADLLYHAMVLLSSRNVKLEQVFEVLRNRFSQSGIDEKNSRSRH